MLLNLFWIVIGLLVVLTIMQFTYVLLYLRTLRRPLTSNALIGDANDLQPRAAVILCVRGEDPTLLECLTGLSLQSYRNFEFHVVADHEDDPALEVVRSFFENDELANSQPTIHILKEHPTNRTLKCSALIAAISQLDETIEVVALIDADVVADQEWLADLIRPLSHASVGATTGNRWFSPSDRGLGSLVRQAWNAGALPQMTLYGIPWGGSLAIKRTTIEDCRLLEAWANAFCEDTMLSDILNANDLSIVRVPNLIVANGETTTLSRTGHWITRQLLTVRLHHKNWPLVVLHGLACGVCLVGPAVIAFGFLIQQSYLMATFSVVALLIFQLINMGLVTGIRGGNVKVIESRNVALNEAHVSLGLTFLVSIAAQWTYVVAVMRALVAKKVSWRGINYAISRKKVTMEGYQPIQNLDLVQSNNVSID